MKTGLITYRLIKKTYQQIYLLMKKYQQYQQGRKQQNSKQALNYSRERSNSILPRIPDRKIKREGSTSFISQVQRFNTKQSKITPGPGSYQLNQSKVFKEIQKQQLLPRQHLWILQDKRFKSYVKSPTGPLGPGCYDVALPIHKSSHKNKDWGSSQRFNTKSQYENIGPGSYNYKVSQQNSIGSIFRSNQARTFDKLIYHTNKLDKANSLTIQTYKDSSPGPGSYAWQQKQKLHKGPQKSTNFVSKVPRFLPTKVNENISPGMYNYQSDIDKKIREIKQPKNSIVRVTKLPQKIVKQKSYEEPGPGSYQTPKTLQNRLLKKYLNGYKGQFGSRQERFQNTNYHKYLPGPGHYNRPQKSIQFEHKLKHLKISSNFISNSERKVFVDELKKQVPFGSYNLKMFDISYHANRKREHLQKLRKIEIEIPAFEVGSKR